MKITLLSYNVFGSPFSGEKIIKSFLRTKVRNRFRHIAKGIVKEELDILLFQEVHTYPHFFLLRHNLKNYKHVIYRAGVFGPKGGLVIFSKIPLEKENYLDFYEKGDLWNKTFVGVIGQRGVLYCKIKDKNVWLLNTHLTQNSTRNWDKTTTSRKMLRSQLHQATSLVTMLQSKNNSLIFGGDFNMPHTIPLYKEFTETTVLKDSFADTPKATYHILFEGLDSYGRIDYIFYSDNKDIQLDEQKYMFTEPLKTEKNEELLLSDHVALVATFSLL